MGVVMETRKWVVTSVVTQESLRYILSEETVTPRSHLRHGLREETVMAESQVQILPRTAVEDLRPLQGDAADRK